MIIKLLSTRLRSRLENASADNRAILGGMTRITAFLTLAKLIAAGKEVLIAERYGTSSVIDGYLFVFNLAQWPVNIFSIVTAVVMIPYLVKLRRQQATDAKNVQAAFLTLTMWLGIVVGGIVLLSIFLLVSRYSLGLTLQSRSSALTALPWVSCGIVFAFMSTVTSNSLMSQRRYVNTLLEAMPAAVIALCLLTWPVASGQDWDVWPLAVGTLLGFSLRSIVLGKLSPEKIGFKSLGIIAQHWPGLRGTFGIMLVVQLVLSSTSVLDQFFSISMGEGVLASYTYASRIMALVLSLTAIVIGRSILPVFSGIDDINTSYAMALRWGKRVAFFGLIVAPVLFFTAEWVVTIIFQRGAFTENDTHEVAQIIGVLALQLPFYLYNVVLVQWLASLSKVMWLIPAATASFLAKLAGVIIWYDHGALGLAASTSLMYVVASFMNYVAIRIVRKRAFDKR